MTSTSKLSAAGLMLAFVFLTAATNTGFGQTVSSNDPNQELSLSINKIGNISVPHSYLTVKGDLIVLTDSSAPVATAPPPSPSPPINHDAIKLNSGSTSAGNTSISSSVMPMNGVPIRFNSGSTSADNTSIPSATTPGNAYAVRSNNGSSDSFYEHVMLSGILIQLKNFPQESPNDSSASKPPENKGNSPKVPVRMAAIQANPDSGKVLAYFLHGPWLRRLDDKNSGDIVFIKGGFVRGRVVGLAHQKLLVNRNGAIQDIPIASIIDIRSPRAFYFSISPPTSGFSIGFDCVLKETMPSRVLESQSIRPPVRDDDDDFGTDNLAPLSMPAPIWMPNRQSMPGFNDGSAVDSMGVSPFSRFR